MLFRSLQQQPAQYSQQPAQYPSQQPEQYPQQQGQRPYPKVLTHTPAIASSVSKTVLFISIVKMHGSSNANAVKNSILKAIPFAEENVVGIISESVFEIEEVLIEEE